MRYVQDKLFQMEGLLESRLSNRDATNDRRVFVQGDVQAMPSFPPTKQATLVDCKADKQLEAQL